MTDAKTLISDCLETIDKKYGLKSKHYLPYHNTEHARDVMEAANAIGKSCGLSEYDLELVSLAACFHDVEHGVGRGDDERISAELAGQKMLTAGYSAHDITLVQDMILATIVKMQEGVLLQSATENILTQIIADADLASFGRTYEIFWDRSLKLYAENSETGELSKESKKDFVASQIHVLENHTFYVANTEKVFPYKQSNISMLKMQLKA